VTDRSVRATGSLAATNLAIRFLLELALLAALAVWGFRAVEPLWLRFALGLVAPAIALVAWGAFVAPRAPGFFMRATPVEQVREVAETGESMPPKSTYFYPKVPTGLVFNPLT
jgi:hypothetical protein